MTVVDTSVWVDFFNSTNSVHANALKSFIEDGKSLCLTGIILTEILQGVKNQRRYSLIKGYLLDFPIFRENCPYTHLLAAEIFRNCRKKGITVRNTVDCLIAAVAIENKLNLFHNDSDFTQIERFNHRLKIYSMV